ncbi:rhomboid family intramembrane serine protease [Gallibacterium melopsittaci]|uniref:Rhomboid family intramembrane serine protease n=1 Tax=Gallibacterium melopsittaci TaxID=516063 RepID=A0ABV6HUY6_9PAST
MYYLFSCRELALAKRFQEVIYQQYHYQIDIRQQDDYFHLYLINDSPESLDNTQQLVAEFMQNPDAAKFNQAEWQSANTVSFAQIYRPFIQGSIGLNWQHLFSSKFTFLITLVCIVIYGTTWLNSEIIFDTFHFPELPAQSSDIWRYLSHTLVHLSIPHLVFNLLWWWIFAGLIERLQGIHRIVLIYLVAGVASGFAQYFASGIGFFGLSGVVYAVLGYVWIESRFNQQKIFDVPIGFSWFLIIGIVSGFFSPLIGLSMGNSAHIAGLCTGCVLAGVDIWWNRSKSQ